MGKDAYYFPHDSNARHDPKILSLRSRYKMEGFGLYWAIVEMMREQEDFQLPIDNGCIEGYALDLNCQPDYLTTFIQDCIKLQLFQSDDNVVWSDSLNRRMFAFVDKSEKARASALARWGKDNATAMRTQCYRNANAMLSKVKESKVKESIREEVKLPSFIDRDLFSDFMEMRKKKRVPNTDRAQKLLIDRLIEFNQQGFDANKIIEDSIMRGWTGVFTSGQGTPKSNEMKESSKYGHMVQK